VVASVQELERMIRERAEAGESARMVAGFCWPWSDELVGGKLAEDVRIGSWRRPWNARPEMRRLPKGIPKSNFWATDPNGLDQVGCVYTAQGFEFDYVGVIVGKDLRYDAAAGGWIGDRSASADPAVKRASEAEFLQLVKSVYRVLLTRGLKGCWVTFLDEATERFVRSRMESRPEAAAKLAAEPPVEAEPVAANPHLRRLTRRGLELWPLFEPYGAGPRAVPVDALIGIANDAGWLLEREDLAGWERDAARREALAASLRRVLSEIGALPEREGLVGRILAREPGAPS